MKLLFVCLGNICRSPTAHGVMLKKLADAKIDWVTVDSAGTASYHIGRAPDERSQLAASQCGYDLSSLSARQVIESDFFEYDYIFAMDKANLENLNRKRPVGSTATVKLFLKGVSRDHDEVPDPYYGSSDGFKTVIELCEQACDAIIADLIGSKK